MFYSSALIYTHICRVLEWFHVIKPLITELFSKIMFRVEIFSEVLSWQPSALQQTPSASSGKNRACLFPTKSESNGAKAMAGLRCVATWQMSPRGKT